MKKTENTRKSFRSRAARLTAMILTVLMAVMMLPTHAFAASDESGSLSAYTLYNYISLNNGSTYISLNTQSNGIRTAKSAQDFHRENGNKRYDLSADEYEIDDPAQMRASILEFLRQMQEGNYLLEETQP